MSMMSDRLMPSACEVDVTGVASMYALQLASGTPAGLVDWNNNYANDPDKCVLFHCGNWAKSFLPDARMEYADVLVYHAGHGKHAWRDPPVGRRPVRSRSPASAPTTRQGRSAPTWAKALSPMTR